MDNKGAQPIQARDNASAGSAGASLTDNHKKDLQKKVEDIYNAAMQKVRELEEKKQAIVKQYIRELEQKAIQKVRDRINNLPDNPSG